MEKGEAIHRFIPDGFVQRGEGPLSSRVGFWAGHCHSEDTRDLRISEWALIASVCPPWIDAASCGLDIWTLPPKKVVGVEIIFTGVCTVKRETLTFIRTRRNGLG